MKKKINNISYKLLLIIVSMLIAIPSIIYLIKNKTVLKFNSWFTFFLRKPETKLEAYLGAIIFGILLIAFIFIYFKLIKKSNNEFKNFKKLIIYIIIISFIFGIMLPFTTSDIFYYMGTGWIDSNYNENPYYTTVNEVRVNNLQDEILQRTGIWENQVVVYGPLWAFICKILSFLSFGNVTICLYIFKLFAITVHVLNTILIYKLTNKKKKFAIYYGLNPFILFEMITNVHNDIYMLFFIFISLYFLLKKKNVIFAVIFMALATSIKYLAVLVIPFMVLYYLRNEKLGKKILMCILYAVIFLSVIFLIYLIYAKDKNIFFVMTMQQEKYRESILTIMLELSSKLNIDILTYSKSIFILIFTLVFLDGLIYMAFCKKVTIRETMKKCYLTIFVFLFFIITNLCPWYTSWLIIPMFWLKGKDIKNILYIQFSYEFVTLINFALNSESYKIGLVYLPIMVIIIMAFRNLDDYLKVKKLKEEKTIG